MGVSEALLIFVSNFAKTGDPNVPGINKDVPDYGTPREKTRYRGLTWDPYEIGSQYYLSISKYKFLIKVTILACNGNRFNRISVGDTVNLISRSSQKIPLAETALGPDT